MNIQSGLFWLILTTFLEARDQPPLGQKNVVKIILNRADMRQWPLENIVFAKKQFSCYNDGLPKAFAAVAGETKSIAPVTINVLEAVKEWEAGDNLGGATHYFNPDLVPGGWPRSWDKKKMRVLGKTGEHIFLIEV